MDKQIVKELIQGEMTVDNCVNELTDLLNNPLRREQLLQDYSELKKLLSLGGHASKNAAEIICGFVKN